MSAVLLTGGAQQGLAQEKEKAVKDQGEFDIYNDVVKDVTTNNWSKAIQDLDTWTQKYPDSDYKDDRLYDYLQAYAKSTPPQAGKVMELGAQLMDKDLNKLFKDPRMPLTIYFLTTTTAQSMQNPTPEQLALGDKAAHKLQDASAAYFVAANKPSGATDDVWAAARKTMDDAAKNFFFFAAMLPGKQAMDKKDCAAAEAAYSKALGAYPDRAAVAYSLAGAYACGQKQSQALYEYARTVAIDPAIGGGADPARTQAFVKKAYDDFHGSDEGYDQLLQQAKNNPLPPADFKIENANVIAAQKRADWEKNNPELARWEGIKSNLAAQGAQFFEGSMKDAAIPTLMGKIVEAKPACRPKELLVAMPTQADGSPQQPEISLKFETPLTGKPELGTAIKFDGVARAFTAAPFMVTMEVEKDKIQNLNLAACAAPATKKGPTKKQ